MLEDRDYMRQPAYHTPRVSLTVGLLIVNAIVFVIQLLASHSLQASEIEAQYFALSLYGLEHGYIWQLLTFQFMHAGWGHIIFNSIAIYFFGRPVETVLGGRKFLILYFSSGIIGGLVQMLFTVLPFYSDGPVMGASAGASGLIAAFAVMNWELPFTLFLYFIPVTMRGRTLFWVSIAIVVLGMITPGSNIANAAHLGGILTGFLYTRYFIRGNWFPSRPAAPQERSAHLEMKSLWRSSKKQASEESSAEDFLQREVDPILEKISAHGIQSLTARERETLQKARSKIEKQ